MKRLLRLLALLLAGAAGLLVLAGVAGFVYLRASLPQTEGRIALKGLTAPVEVVRDRHGVVRIRAGSLWDLLFAQGFVHAQERLWQMEFQRRVGQGRLSEVLGEATLAQDRFLRTWGFYQAAKSAYERLYPEEKEAVDAYVAGVNAFLASGAPLPPEFALLGFRPEPWRGPDVLVWAKMMSFDLSGNWEEELLRHRLLARGVSPERLLELLPPYPEDAPTVLSAEDLRLPLRREEAPSALLPMAPPRFLEASNNWVVAGSRTATGKPFLADDPHLGLQAPSLWFLMALEAPGYRAVGASLPGVPGIVIGRNERIAWGVTNVGADVQDLYLLEEVGTGYRYRGQVLPYRVREEVIRIKGGREERLKVRETVYGPVITDALADPPKTPMALRWVSLDPEDHILMAYLGINRAKNWVEFQEALKLYSAPSQNFVYADIDGNIGYIAPGKFPIRREGHTGMVPVPGNGAWDWQGYRPPETWPMVLNPKEGLLVTANHKVTPKGFPYALTYDWAEPYRAERILELLRAKEKLTLEDMKAIQQDQKSLLFRDFRPVLSLLNPLSERARAWRERLLAWDGTMAPSSEEALVFALWYTELTRLPEKEVGEAHWDEPRYLLKALKEGDKNCDQPETEYPETCLDYAALALERALDRKEALKAKAWGEVHRAAFRHPVLTHTPLRRLSDRQVAFGGDRYTANVGPFDPQSLTMGHGPSYRQIVDLSNPEGSLFVHPMGQSGHLLSPHYADLLPLWARGDYLPMAFSGEGRTLLLEPGR
ncbi:MULTISPECIES: penicillin acylase family protein [Thermus]|jgi:penicillin amidase|uniref:Penicillin acylase II n=1 Tax=Thermus brockianus TaxID=56956 RepID=A0A1J0LT21_THEBO|nr:penicillin acylase family protein [Thermus brockianus]APD09180.1 penicillin acylase II [Thermus brockianus]